jgi:SsrA-binding protein
MSTYVDNRKARFDYEILETFDAGISLLGFEVKSIKKGRGSLEGSHVIVRGGEAFLIGMNLPPYQQNNTPKDYSPTRNRKLLLNKSELHQIADKEAGKGMTIVPLSIFSKGNLIKVSIGIVRGKKKFDKRESIKKRETDRAVRREFSDR